MGNSQPFNDYKNQNIFLFGLDFSKSINLFIMFGICLEFRQ